MKEEIEALGGTVLESVDTPIAETSTAHAAAHHLAAAEVRRQVDAFAGDQRPLLRLHGPSLAAAGIEGNGAPVNVAAGDGSESAYQRIRAKQYQAVTVAEPLNLQGWQLVDELNRAFAGETWSGYVSPLHVVTTGQCRIRRRPEEHVRPGQRLSRRLQEDLGSLSLLSSAEHGTTVLPRRSVAS